MADKDSLNSATGIIYSQLKKENMQQNFGSTCPDALKKILNQNFQNEYLKQQQHVVSEESKTKKRLNYDRMMEINDQENQRKEIIFSKFLDAVQNSKKYWDQNFYRAPFQVKTKGLTQCIDDSSQWYQQKTKEVTQRDNYMRIVDKFSLAQKQTKFHEAPDLIYKIEEQVQQEIQNITEQDIISQNNHSDKNELKEEQKYYLMNNFQKNDQLLKPSLPNSRSSYFNNSKVKRQSTNSNDPSSTQPTQTSFNSQFIKKIYSNDYTQIQNEIGRLQKAENEKEAQNIIQSQQILKNKIVARNMSSLFNIKKKSKSNLQQDKSAINLNNSEQSISIQGKNIQTLSQNFFQKIQVQQAQEYQKDLNKTQAVSINRLEFDNEVLEGVTPDRCSPFLQPKMRQVMSQTMRSFSLDRNTTNKLIQRPQSARVPPQYNYNNQNLRPQSAQSTSLLAQMSSFPTRSTKKISIKKGLIKRAQSANPKIQLKNTNKENLFHFIPIKYTNLRADVMINNPQKETSYGNFFAQNNRFSKNQYEKTII